MSKLQDINKEISLLKDRLNELYAAKKAAAKESFVFCSSCGKRQKTGRLVLVKVHYYDQYGCCYWIPYDGGYWNCLGCKSRNNIREDDLDVDKFESVYKEYK